jgi:hypothetical protein
MKLKIFFCLPVLFFLFTLRAVSAPVPTASAPLDLPSKEAIAAMTDEQKAALARQIEDRVDYIKAMDKSQLTKDERKALRAELKDMKKEARYVTGVYISVGALIIIILLLIILL